MDQISINKIKLFNFKSFKGEHVISGLEPHFNTIIGPNGSGKSNIIDSILFALGFKAKRMRHKINADLIYQGTVKEKECYVEIIFSKGTDKLVIKRKLVYNKSTYYVNNNEVTQKELVELMESEGVDIENNRFLILQGEIESISLMKPKNNGMLEYIEDVIGTAKYLEEIEILEKEYKQGSETFENKTSTFKFYEKEFQFIKDKKEQNEKCLKEHIEKINVMKKLNTLKKQKLINENEVLIEKKESYDKEMQIVNEKNKEFKQKMSLLETDLFDKKKEIAVKEKELKDEKQKFFELDKQNFINENKRDKLNKTIKDLKSDLETKTKRNVLSEKELKFNEEFLNEIIESKTKLEKEINILKDDIKKNINKKEQNKINTEIKKLENQIFILSKSKDEVNEKIFAYQKLVDERNELEEYIFHLEENTQEKLNNTRNDKLDHETLLYDIEKDIVRKKREIVELENKQNEINRSEYNKTSQNKIVEILKEIKGFIGRLGDLGTTKKEFDVAVNTAGKGYLNNMVVEDTETAEICIDLLKRNNLERTSFIIYNKMKEVRLQGDFEFLLNKIECDEKYKKLFYFALGDTILCKNIEQAKLISFGNNRRKCVTIDGQMIEKSGLMSGGGFVTRNMKISQFDYKKNDEMLKKIKNELQNLINKKNETSQAINNCNKILYEFENESSKFKFNATEAKNAIKKITESIKNENYNDYINELKKLDADINEVQLQITGLQNNLEDLEGIELKKKRSELGILFEKNELTEAKIEEVKKKLKKIEIFDTEETKNTISKIEDEINNIKDIKDYNKRKNLKEKLENKFKSLFDDVKEINDEIKVLKEAIGKDFDKEIELINNINEIKETLKRNKEQINVFNNKKTELINECKKYAKFTSLKNEEENLNIDNNEIEELISRAEKKIKNLTGNNNLDLKIFEEFEIKKKEFEIQQKEFNNCKIEVENIKIKLNVLKKQRNNEFMMGFNEINKNLKEIYQILTFGGNAELELVDYFDPFSEGISLSVMPPKKSWKNVSTLSGGEKTLSSLALVFALHVYKPSPFYVMDEIDAALDFRNVSIISNYIYEKTKNAQFLIISLRNDMFEKSNILIGVYKNDNLSKTTVFNIDELKKEQLKRKELIS
ncbi:Structural maintenance of chromosomes protein 4 [Conglomerata obtusa]